jgi:hypothetical protein
MSSNDNEDDERQHTENNTENNTEFKYRGLTRYYKLITIDDNNGIPFHRGRYSGLNPDQAANKAITSLIRNNKTLEGVATKFCMQECGNDTDKHKTYYYSGSKELLDSPKTVNIDRPCKEPISIRYKSYNKINKISKDEYLGKYKNDICHESDEIDNCTNHDKSDVEQEIPNANTISDTIKDTTTTNNDDVWANDDDVGDMGDMDGMDGTNNASDNNMNDDWDSLLNVREISARDKQLEQDRLRENDMIKHTDNEKNVKEDDAKTFREQELLNKKNKKEKKFAQRYDYNDYYDEDGDGAEWNKEYDLYAGYDNMYDR